APPIAQAFNNMAVHLPAEATIANLSAGTYNDIAITVNGCTSTEDVDVTLSDPATPTVALDASSDPTTCGGNDGSITLLFTNVPAGNHTISYVDGANNAQAFNNASPTRRSSDLIANLSAGTYNDIAI